LKQQRTETSASHARKELKVIEVIKVIKVMIKKIGIIAASGDLPKEILENCYEQGIETYYVNLRDIGNYQNPQIATKYIESKLTNVGKILNFLRENKVNKIIFAGGLKRPSFTSLIPDLKGMQLLARLQKLKKGGDNTIFKIIFKFLEEEGFEMAGVKDIAPALLTQQGVIGSVEPKMKQMRDVELAKDIAVEIGKMDIGQAAVAHEGSILGVEGIDGTDALIKRCKTLHFKGKGGVLAKMKKPDQDDRIDLPTIGIKTIRNLDENGFSGVVLEAGNSIILNKSDVIDLADELGIFIYGV